MPLHRFFQEFKGSLAISRLGDDAFQHLALVINSPPKVVSHAVDLHVDFVQVPLPLTASAHRLDPLASDLGGEHRTEPVPPVSHRLVTDLDTPLMQEILDVSKRQRKTNVEHHRQADDLGARLEVSERRAFGHPCRLGDSQGSLKQSSSDNTGAGAADPAAFSWALVQSGQLLDGDCRR